MTPALIVNTAGASTELLLLQADKSVFYRDPDGRRASLVLLPKIDEILDGAGLAVSDISLFGCCVGPGSFTGIRIGTVTMRTLAHRLHKPLLGLNYHRILAYNGCGADAESIVTVLNGWGQNCYVSVFSPRSMTELLPPSAMTYAEAGTFLTGISEPYALIADEPAQKRLAAGTVYDPELCMRRYVTAEAHTAGDHCAVAPLYVLPSQAERDLK